MLTRPRMLIGWLLLLSLLAGCAHRDGDGRSPSDSVTPSISGNVLTSTTAQTPGPTMGPLIGRPTEMFWTDCAGAQGTLPYPVPPQPPVPPGEQIMWHYLECQRVSIGPYERGPVHFVLETSTAGMPPESCLDNGTFIEGDLMHNLWISNAEIAAYTVESLGMPAQFATFRTSSEVQQNVETFTVEWGHPDYELSNMTFVRHGAVASSSAAPYRNFWFNETLLGYMDIVFDSQGYDAGGPLIGQMAPPSIYAPNGMAMPLVGAKGSVDIDMEVKADLYYFGDPECKEPA